MAWETNYDHTHSIVEVIYTGLVSRTEVNSAATKRIKLQEETGSVRVIINAAGINKSTAGIMDLFALPAKMYVEKRVSKLTRMAIFLPSSTEEKETVQFFETACINRGWMAKIFFERKDAIDWLVE